MVSTSPAKMGMEFNHGMGMVDGSGFTGLVNKDHPPSSSWLKLQAPRVGTNRYPIAAGRGWNLKNRETSPNIYIILTG